MVYSMVVFLALALAAAFVGFLGLAGELIWVAKVCFLAFLLLFILSATISAVRGRPPV